MSANVLSQSPLECNQTTWWDALDEAFPDEEFIKIYLFWPSVSICEHSGLLSMLYLNVLNGTLNFMSARVINMIQWAFKNIGLVLVEDMKKSKM